MIYEFFWGDRKQLIKIESSDAAAVEPEIIETLLSQYRKRAAISEYNIDGWCAYLEHLGYAVRMIEPDYSMYF